MGSFEVILPGLFTTIQDQGRMQHQQYGVCAAGVMDPFAHKTANILCGNGNWDEAVLELTMMGPTLKFHDDAFIAVTGADLGPMLDGAPVANWQSFVVRGGSTLSFSGIKTGARAYIAFRGGLDVSPVMGSKSTYTRAKIGGFEGRPLQQGDIVCYAQTDVSVLMPKHLPQKLIPQYPAEQTLRVVLGPQDDAFTADGISAFLTNAYTVTNKIDRMGYRLEGVAIEHKSEADIISDGIVMGAVQVPGDGQPIILMADRQTTGGYTKIGCVIYADLAKVAQAKQGDTFRFANIPINIAQEIYAQFHTALVGIATEHAHITSAIA